MATVRSRQRALDYLRVAHLYRLGELPTERPHPVTRQLSKLAQDDLPRAVAALRRVDLDALARLEAGADGIAALAASVERTLQRGARIFLCGCGATGRLSLSLELLWRKRGSEADRVRAFMAGGDVALVNSLEGFEDHPEYGARHLEQMGFAEGDLLISSTEGGETPYVIGATERAARISANRPWFLYCNPDDELSSRVERSRRVLADPRIRKLCLHVGPMALAGSTRMQASTVLQLAVGAALLHRDVPPREVIRALRGLTRDTDLSFVAPLVEHESAVYLDGRRTIYRVRDYAITVFTDTTERAPTFSLVPFDRLDGSAEPRSLCYVLLEDAPTADAAWRRLLARDPRPLEWHDVDPRTTADHLRGFDFSATALDRPRPVPVPRHAEFRIHREGGAVRLELDGLRHDLATGDAPPLLEHLLLKQVLNMHSTLVMGRLGRYEGNLMTWVTPTNGKLVDRAARYVRHLLADAGRHDVSYEDVIQALFAQMERTPPGESVVLRTWLALKNDAPPLAAGAPRI